MSFSVPITLGGALPAGTPAMLAASGGTSGVVIDNTVASGTLHTSQIYFSTLTGGTAVQASQAALQQRMRVEATGCFSEGAAQPTNTWRAPRLRPRRQHRPVWRADIQLRDVPRTVRTSEKTGASCSHLSWYVREQVSSVSASLHGEHRGSGML
jgi:hypothetical protein